MTIFWQAVYVLLFVFLLCLIARVVISWVMVFAPRWRPTGVVAAGLELVYSATDPPVRALRRVIPPLRVGNVSFDLGFVLLFVAVYILMGVAQGQAH